LLTEQEKYRNLFSKKSPFIHSLGTLIAGESISIMGKKKAERNRKNIPC
jgi:hypothetical protein